VEVLLAALGPMMGLVGTVFGLWIGQRRWKRDSERKDAESFQISLRKAYTELWSVVEAAHLKMRKATTDIGPGEFSGFLADINDFMIEHGLYIERKDRFLVLEYLFWTNEYLGRFSRSRFGRVAIDMTVTSSDLGMQVRELEELELRHRRLRNELRRRIREVLGAPVSHGWSDDVRPSHELASKLKSLVESVDQNRYELRTEAEEANNDRLLPSRRRPSELEDEIDEIS